MLRTILLSLTLASLASGSTVFTVIVQDGDTLIDSSLFASGTPYIAAFQLTGGTTSDSVAAITGIDLGGGFSAPGSIFATSGVTYGASGLPDGSLTLKVTPSDSFNYFFQTFTAGSQFAFTVTLTGVFSPPTPDEFAFQLYDQTSAIVYEQDFNVTDATPPSAPEPATWTLLVTAGMLSALRYRRHRNQIARTTSEQLESR